MKQRGSGIGLVCALAKAGIDDLGVVIQENGLDIGVHIQRLHALCLLLGEDLRVYNAVSCVGARMAALRKLDSIQHEIGCAVADSMDGNLHAVCMRDINELVECLCPVDAVIRLDAMPVGAASEMDGASR